jgi:hypothetical protein
MSEPLLIMNGDGLDIFMEDGKTVSVDQVINCVTLLLFSSPDNYHHDVFLKNKNWKFRGNYFKTASMPITMQMLSDLDSAVELDLSPLVDDGIIFDLKSLSKNPTGKRIETEISFIYNGDPVSKKILFDSGSMEMI